ncbi:prephenate dehydratase [Rhodoligotrophos appendicifer]|uniref:prephenate dehydratase n=1 Tax=Rhodoligotrophos appendicifer TaxID=987056 RepID=UPI00117BF007|nr:prephenate dehydratase [Rhodoligotrophos appendicifer]
MSKRKIVYQGEPGANSHIACTEMFPDDEPIASETFPDAFAALTEGRVDLAMIPIDNTLAGRVADIHHLIPESNVYFVGEHFLRVNHQLLAIPGTKIEDLKTVSSHPHALGQCRKKIRALGLKPITAADTAGAAREVAELKDPSHAAIATGLAARIYGLTPLVTEFEDAEHNTTRFVVLSAKPNDAEPEEAPVLTSFIFKVRNVPAALYKALGGFATNGVNMIKLESYVDEGFNVAQFYADVVGHPMDRNVKLALEELAFFTTSLRILGVYKASPLRALWRMNESIG